MDGLPPGSTFRFGVFTVDPALGELRRKGHRVRLGSQPMQLLLLLLAHPGELIPREAICQHLWPDGTFVDFEHGVNSAANRLREALGDAASNPRFIETLSRKGYRFIAPLEVLPPAPWVPAIAAKSAPDPHPSALVPAVSTIQPLATPNETSPSSLRVAQLLYLLIQILYAGLYVVALANLTEIDDLLSTLPQSDLFFILLIATAAALIPARAFAIVMILFSAPRARQKLLQLWRFLLLPDLLCALAPFLFLHRIHVGLALALAMLLVYAPFAQRSFIQRSQTPHP